MLGDDLLGAYLSRHIKGNFFFKPRGHDHAGHLIFNIAEGARDDVSHTVDEADIKRGVVVEHDLDRLFGDELRFSGHDRLARRRLGQLIGCALLAEGAVYVGNDQGFHKLFNKGGLSRAHGADDSDVDIPVGALGDVLIDTAVFHTIR